MAQKLRHRATNLAARIAEPAAGLQDVGRKVDPIPRRVLGDVATDVGQLHGDAEVGRPPQRRAIPHPHDLRHHQTDGPGRPVAIEQQPVEVPVTDGAHVHRHAVDELLGVAPRDRVPPDDLLEPGEDRIALDEPAP